MKPVTIAIGLAALSAAPAWSNQYYVAYEASGVYPEDCGWTRLTLSGGAQRWFEDGSLVIDSRASTGIADAYIMERPGQLDPGPGELFVMSWRMRTDELQGPYDSNVWVFSDERRGAFLDLSTNGIHVPGEGVVATFQPGLFHDFEFRSADMLTYYLYVDGTLGYAGDFTVPLLQSSRFGWGDDTQGGASLSRWDYFRVAVVPESSSVCLALVVGLAVLERARARRQ